MSLRKKLYKMVSFLKSKTIYPSAYAFVFKDVGRGTQHIALTTGYTYEEAIYNGKMWWINRGEDKERVKHWQVTMFTSVELGEMLQEYSTDKLETEVATTTEDETKNRLMLQIIEKQDSTLLEKNISKFSEAEVQYLRAKLEEKIHD